jgi:hypothetical protein
MRASRNPTSLLSFPALLLAGGALFFLVILVFRYAASSLGHDQLSYIFEAQRMLSGAQPYGPYLSETNPPVIIWFSALPALFAQATHTSPIPAFRLLVVVMTFISIGWCLRILRRNPPTANPVSLILLGCALFTAEYYLIGEYDFGQREHLLVILLLPYLLAVATGVVERLSFAERCTLGAVAGIAIWFKPQDTLVLVVLELFLALRHRTLRRLLKPEFLAMISASALILLLVRLLTPLYFSETLPLLFDTYWALGNASALALTLHLHLYGTLVFVALLICFFCRNYLREPATSAVLFLCSAAASVGFVIQHTDWAYHFYPHRALLVVALAYLACDLFHPLIERSLSTPRITHRLMLAASACMTVLLVVAALHPHRLIENLRRKPGIVDRFFIQYKPGTNVYVFSTAVPPFEGAYDNGMNWGSRYVHMWMMPAILQNELGRTSPPSLFKKLSPQRLAALESLQRTRSAEDLDHFKPSIVLVEQCNFKHQCQGIEGKTFDMASWLMQSPQFAAAWSHYQRQPNAPVNYDLYVRVP